MAKIFSTTSEPVIRSTISGASTVIMGISALRSAWRKISAGPEMPLLQRAAQYFAFHVYHGIHCPLYPQ